MRCYKVEAPGCVRLAPTGGEARAYRQAMVEERDIKKKDVDINPVELKTAKPELLSFLNGLLEYLDDKEDFEMPEELSVVDKAAQKAAREAKKKAKPRTTLGEGTPELTKLGEEKTGTKKTTPVKKGKR